MAGVLRDKDSLREGPLTFRDHFISIYPYNPLPEIDNPPRIQSDTMLSVAGQFYTHGFAMRSLNASGVATADYYEDLNGVARKLYSGAIDCTIDPALRHGIEVHDAKETED